MRSSLRLVGQSAAAHRAQSSGEETEREVDRIHAGLAPCWHVERQHTRRLGSGRPIDTQGCDFSGYRETGTYPCAVLVEVKRVTNGRLDFARLTWRQVRDLTLLSRAGGLAVVLCIVGEHLGSALWCPVLWQVLEPAVLGWVRHHLPEWEQQDAHAAIRAGKRPQPSPWRQHVWPLTSSPSGPVVASASLETLTARAAREPRRYLDAAWEMLDG